MKKGKKEPYQEKKLTRKKISEIESFTWTVMERCLERTHLENRDQVRNILSKINTSAIKKGYYNTMGLFFSHFFSSFSLSPQYFPGEMSFSERLKKRNSKFGIMKRNAEGALTRLQDIDFSDKEIEKKLAQLGDLIEKEFIRMEQFSLVGKGYIRHTEEMEARKEYWRDNTRLIEAIRLLEAIEHTDPYKTISDLLELIPPFEILSRQRIRARVKRHS